MWRINRRRHGLFICAFNRFRIKGPPLPEHADWQEIARHPARHPKNRYELRRRDKIVFRSIVSLVLSLLLSPCHRPPLASGSTILRRYSETTAFSCGLWRARSDTCVLGEIHRADTIELSYCKSLFQPSRSPHRNIRSNRRDRKRERVKERENVFVRHRRDINLRMKVNLELIYRYTVIDRYVVARLRIILLTK